MAESASGDLAALDTHRAILRDGLTPADEILLRYERDWGRRTDPLFTDYAF